MITAIYASILALLMCGLAFNVIKARRKNKIRYADGNVEELQIARTAHSNAVDYIPITLILLFILEYNGANIWFIHLAGILLIVGRAIHCKGILSENLRGRILGMKITFFTITSLAFLNLIYAPYEKFLLF
ncbi:MAG: putative membrane protein YecN with MAPEG domain [Gammaproteobacteria bacterium]|jgi:uncharacterized membrane protein YecN with MAPEG domain